MARSQATVLGILDREMPTTVSGSREIATAVAAPLEVAQQIECIEGEPVLRIERVHFGAEGRPVERCINWFNPHRYVYRFSYNGTDSSSFTDVSMTRCSSASVDTLR